MDSQFQSVADAVESQVCVEIRRPGVFAGAVRPLAQAARAKQGAAPVLLAAQKLRDAVKPGDVVLISTGFHVPGVMPAGETDGPPGAAALAFAISKGLGATPVLVAEESTLPPVRAACRTLGLREERDLAVARQTPQSFITRDYPVDGAAEAAAQTLLDTSRPAAIVVIERPGLNRLGVAHRGGGKSIDGGRARIETLTDRARGVGIPYIAIGDNGNEAGMGLIAAETRQYKPFGDVCQCPCGGGIAAVDIADVTVFGSVSNWAAYGIVACLELLLGNESLLHDGATEERLIAASIGAGALDGLTLTTQLMVDEIPARLSGAVVDILQGIVSAALR